MAQQQVLMWTGQQPYTAEELRAGDALRSLLPLPAPAPLRRAARIAYRWGDTRFEIQAAACSVRVAPWGTEPVTWLHCKAAFVEAIQPDKPTGTLNLLIPARYVVAIAPGQTFRLARVQKTRDLGLFPSNRPTPADALPLSEVERVLAELLAPERN